MSVMEELKHLFIGGILLNNNEIIVNDILPAILFNNKKISFNLYFIPSVPTLF
jgi:hypothetical protein